MEWPYEDESTVCVTAESALRNINGAAQPEGTDYTLYQHQVYFLSAEVNVEERRGKERKEEKSCDEESRGG